MKLLYLSILVLTLLSSCTTKKNKYQIQNLKSYSKIFSVKVPIISKLNKKNQKIHWWTIIIEDKDGNELYRDTDKDFIGYLNIYWYWDKNDNLWVYNSDNGCTYFWMYKNGKWNKNLWGCGEKKETKILINRPHEIKKEAIYKYDEYN